jgi:hypothetical protein
VTTTLISPLCLDTSSLNPSMTPAVSPNRPFSESNTKRFFVMSDTGSFRAPVPSARANRVGSPAFRSLTESVGFETKELRSGLSTMDLEMALSSVWTFVRTCGDLASAAEKAALAYLREIPDAARRPKPALGAYARTKGNDMANNQDFGAEKPDDGNVTAFVTCVTRAQAPQVQVYSIGFHGIIAPLDELNGPNFQLGHKL